MAGPDQAAIVEALAAEGLAPSGMPDKLSINSQDAQPSADWTTRSPGAVKRGQWPGGVDFVSVDPAGVVKVFFTRFHLDVDDFLARVARVPFEVAAFGDYHPEWMIQKLRTTSFADGHWPHGW